MRASMLCETAHHKTLTVLGDATRRQIFERLKDGPLSVGVLAEHLPVSRPAVSQHLKALKAAGLVSETAVGTRRLYAIRKEGLDELRLWLDSFADRALALRGSNGRLAS